MTSTADDPAARPPAASALPGHFALLGNPNTGKTTLFNRLCGVRAKTANFPGSTVEARVGRLVIDEHVCRVTDLPGLYGLNLERPESRVGREFLAGEIALGPPPEAVLVVADATNLRRNLVIVSQALQQGLPAVVALNMIDLAARHDVAIDVAALGRRLGCPVVPVCARSGAGMDDLIAALHVPRIATGDLPEPTDAIAAAAWAAAVAGECAEHDEEASFSGDRLTDRLDAFLTHPVLGVALFALVMTGLFYTIFALATVPMDLIELVFAHLGAAAESILPEGAIRDLVVEGVVGGVAGTIVFLPQICLLFFLISLLEDTGYLAPAAFVMDRIMRRFGLPGQAFVPLLTAHACAIPAIMSARLIPDHRERLTTVLVAPFLSCSARLPVYVLLVGVLFPDNALYAGLAFTSCYVLGALAALVTALLVRRTVLRGPSPPMVLELPAYRLPSLRTALLTTLDRAWLFLRKAGTVILGICIVLWWLSAYPRVDPPAEAISLRAEAALVETAQPDDAAALRAEADALTSRHAVAESFAGRIGRTVSPVFAPIGIDWQLSIGVVTSFAAREVFVSTLAVIFAGSDEADDAGVLARIRTARRDDGSPLWTPATAASLLVFYVLALQCLPTVAVTAREAGHWGWALLQFAWMSGLAWLAAFATALILSAAGVT